MKRIGHDFKKIWIRILTLILALAVLPSSLSCFTAFAAPEDDDPSSGVEIYKNGVRYDNEETDIQTGTPWETDTVTGSDTPVYEAMTAQEFNGSQSTIPITDNLYTLTVNTGQTNGDAVKYICVRYLDQNKVPQTKYIFPDTNQNTAMKEYISTLKNAPSDYSLDHVSHSSLTKLGYTINEHDQSTKTLSSWSRDEFLFKTDTPIHSVTAIEALLENGNWSLWGMSISRVTSFGGYREYGYYSGKYYLALGKQPVCRLSSRTGGPRTLSCEGKTKLFDLGTTKVPNFNLVNVPKDNNKTSEEDQNATDSSTLPSADDDLYTFRIDFVDTVGAGLESLLRQNAKNPEVSQGTLAEDMALEVYYADTDGYTRSVTMPVLLSAVGQYMDFMNFAGKDQKVNTMGLCQMGDTIAFTGRLPEMASIRTMTLHVGDPRQKTNAETGGSNAETEPQKVVTKLLETDCGLKMTDKKAKDKAVKELMTDLTKDPITVSSISIDKGTCRMSNTPDGTDTKTKEKLKSCTVVYSFSKDKPILYSTSYDSERFKISPGSHLDFDMIEFTGENGDELIAAKNKANLLIRIKTDTVMKAEPTGTIAVDITSHDSKGEMSTATYTNIEAESLKFYGNWPSTRHKEDNFGYYRGIQKGGIVEFAVSLPNAAFVSAVVLKLGRNSDEWNVSGVSVEGVTSIGRRMIYQQEQTIEYDLSRKSDYRIVRRVVTSQIDPFPVDTKLYIFPGDNFSINLANGKGNTGAKADYFDVQQSMTYQQTKADYGFATSFLTYDVDVKVADDPVTKDVNGDSGSVNQFYFQLDFAKGMSSGYVLANQQLSADGFRAGCDEVFSISVNRDYGDVRAVKIIPADVTEDSEVFDKLNIEKITITQRRSTSFSQQYVFENVGWIGIDYHDSSETNSVKIRQGRSESELAKICTEPVKQNVTNLLCEVTALPWEGLEFKGFVGSLYGEVNYLDVNDTPRTISFDAVSQMASYMNRTPKIFGGRGNDDELGALQNYYATVTDPDWMLRPNHIDRFFLPPIPDMKSLKSISFSGMSRGKEPGFWVIGGLNIFTVSNDSGVINLVGDEVYRQLTTVDYCHWDPKAEEVISRQVLFPLGIGETVTFALSDNSVTWENEKVTTEVTKYPESYNDTLNVYLFPSAKTRNIDGVRVNIELNYYLRQSAKLFHISQKNLDVYDSGKETAMFCYTGLSATGMKGLESLKVRCSNLNILFDRAIVQQVRENVVICTYNISFNNSSATLGLEKSPDPSSRVYEMQNNTKQTLLLSFGDKTADTPIVPKSASNSTGNDIAVSLRYTSTLDRNQNTEYETPYVYLTESDITRIYPGMMAEVQFETPYVDRIIGYKIVSTQKMKASVEGAQAINYCYTLDGKEKTYDMVCSFTEAVDIEDAPSKHNGVEGQNNKDGLTLVDLNFVTNDAVAGEESGISGIVKAMFTYEGEGNTRKKIVDDLSRYIQSTDKSFKTGESANVKFFLPYCSTLKTVTLSAPNDTWKLKSINGYYDYIVPKYVNRAVDQDITNTALDINLGEVIFSTSISVFSARLKKTTERLDIFNHSADVFCASGDRITGSVNLQKNCTDFEVKAEKIENGKAVAVLPVIKPDKRGFTFAVPKRTDKTAFTYRISVWAKENPYLVDVLNVTVDAVNADLKTTVTRTDGTTLQEHDLGTITNRRMSITCLSGDIVSGNVEMTNSTDGFTVKAIGSVEKDGTNEIPCTVSGSRFSLTIPQNASSTPTTCTVTIASKEYEDMYDILEITVPPESSYLSTDIVHTFLATEQDVELGPVSGGKMTISGASGDTITGNVMFGKIDGGFDVRVDTLNNGVSGTDTCTVTEEGFTYQLPGNFTSYVTTVTITVSLKNNPQTQDVITITVPPVKLRTGVSYVGLDAKGSVLNVTDLGYVQNGKMETILQKYNDGRTNEYHFEPNYQYQLSATVLRNGVNAPFTGYSMTDSVVFFRPPANNTTYPVVYTFVLTSAEDPNFKNTIIVTVPGRSYVMPYATVIKKENEEKQDITWSSAVSANANVTCEGGDKIEGGATIYNSDEGFDITAKVTERATGKTYDGKITQTDTTFSYDIPDNITGGVVLHEIRFVPKDAPNNFKQITVYVNPTPAITLKASVLRNATGTAEDLGTVGNQPLVVWCDSLDKISGTARVANSGEFNVKVVVTDQTTQEKTETSVTRDLKENSFEYVVYASTHVMIHDITITPKNAPSEEKRIRVYVKAEDPVLTVQVTREKYENRRIPISESTIKNDSIQVSADSNDNIRLSCTSNIINDVISIELTPEDSTTIGNFTVYNYKFKKDCLFRVPEIKNNEFRSYTLTVRTRSGAQCVVNVVVNAKG